MKPREPILSPAEVEALLDARPAGTRHSAQLEPVSIDLLAGDRYLHRLVPILCVGYARASEGLRRVLTSVLRTKIDVRDEEPEVMTGRGLTAVANQAAALIVLDIETSDHAGGHGLLALDAPLAFAVIQRMFGGAPTDAAPTGARGPTNLERRMLLHALEPVFRTINANLEPIDYFRITPRSIESRLDLVPGFTPDTTALHVPFTVSIGDQLASFSLAFPADLLEPLRDQLDSNAEQMHGAGLSQIVARVPVTVSVELGHLKMSLRDLLALSVGQVLKLNRHPQEELPIQIEGIPKLSGLPVHEGGAVGIEVTSRWK